MVILFLPNCSYPTPLLQIPDSCGVKTLSLACIWRLLAMSFHGGGKKQMWCLFLFHNSFMAGPTPWPHPNPMLSQRLPLPNTIPLVVRDSIDELWVGHHSVNNWVPCFYALLQMLVGRGSKGTNKEKKWKNIINSLCATWILSWSRK